MRTFFQYTWFFFYNAFNWSPWFALFMLYHDIKGAAKYRIKTFQRAALNELTITHHDISKSSPYEAVNYYILEKLLDKFRSLYHINSIIDLGCGKGRVMVVAAHFGFTHITGIDFAKELCEEAIINMKKTQRSVKGIDWKVINANVLDYAISPDDAAFFMFNPFQEETLVLFLDKLEDSCRQFPRATYFLYASPQHADVLERRGYHIVFKDAVLNIEGMILAKEN